MSERSKEAVLKTVEAQVSGGSNPSLSVIHWRGAREAESGSLLSSNPPLSDYETIAQLDRASVCGTEGRRFESSWSRLQNSHPLRVFCFSGEMSERSKETDSKSVVVHPYYRGFESLSLRFSSTVFMKDLKNTTLTRNVRTSLIP